MYGDKNPESPGKMVIGSDERNIPLHCEPPSLQKEMSFKQHSNYYYMPGGQWDYRPVLSLSYDPYSRAGSYTRVSASAGVDFSVARGGDLSLAVGVRGIPNCYNNGFTDRKSTRLNSSHLVISYAVFCLKKKKPATSR